MLTVGLDINRTHGHDYYTNHEQQQQWHPIRYSLWRTIILYGYLGVTFTKTMASFYLFLFFMIPPPPPAALFRCQERLL